VTKLSGPARDGSSTRVFAPLTLDIVNDHTSQKGDGMRLTELSACTREFLAISRSMETSMDSLAGRRWSEVGEVEVVMSRWPLVRPADCTMYSTSHHIVFLLALCPFFLFAFASFPSTNPDGSFPSSSHSSNIFIAARYPFSCISSNLPHCNVPYY
jgi:hypothetical protein